MKKIFLIISVLCMQLALKSVVLADNYYSAIYDKGTIYNVENSTMTISGENIVFYSNISNTINCGGAINNFGNFTITGKDIDFISNTSMNYCGGAISNNSAQIQLSGEKIEFNSNTAGYSGGAICNGDNSTVTIKGRDIFFSSNVAVDAGGAVCNTNNSSMAISSDNMLFSFNNTEFGGGAIFNEDDSIMTINANTITFNFNTAEQIGGAIGNHGSTMIINGEKIKFDYNTAGICGGAIFNYISTMTITGEKIEFSSNTTVGSGGGAIYNSFGATMSISGNSIAFNSNSAETGGAIFNNGVSHVIKNSIITISGDSVNFSSNTAGTAGGAIYNNNSTLNLVSTGKIEFTGNTANNISNAIHDIGGIINLSAIENSAIIFNDRITSENNSSILNINQSTTTLNAVGKVILNEDMTGYTGQVNLYNGEIELQPNKEEGTNINTNKFFSGDINLSSGTLNIQNGAIDKITVNSLTSAANMNLKFDVDLSNNTSDNFSVVNTASGELNLTAINILGVNGTSGQLTLFNDEVAPTLNILTTANYDGKEYKFTNSDVAGILNYQILNITKTFKEVLNDTESEIRSYSLAENEVVTEALGNLGGTQLTIFGNGKDIEGNYLEGVVISKGKQHLVINDAGFNNFKFAIANKKKSSSVTVNSSMFNNNNDALKGSAIYNLGYIEVNNSTFSSNSSSYGGALINGDAKYSEGKYAKAYLNNVLFENNLAETGGAILNDGNCNMTINDVSFSNNTANGRDGIFGGGAIANKGKMAITGNSLFGNNYSIISGGAIENRGNLNINGVAEFIGNKATQNGGAIYNTSTMTITGENVVFNNNRASSKGGAIYNAASILNLVSTGKIEFTGNTAAGISNAIHDGFGTINLYASKNAQIIFNDRITSINNESILNINPTSTANAIGTIILNEDMRGYTGQVNLYAGTVQIGQYGTWFAGNTYVDNATIDMANSVLQEHNFNTLRVKNNLNLFVDADLAKKQMDTITANDYSGSGKINITAINILSDATENKTEILFTNSTVLQDKITTVKTASSNLYKYDVNYNNSTGEMSFNKRGINPVLAQSQVANEVGGTITQTAILNKAFTSIDTQIADIRLATKQNKQLYASTVNQLFSTSKLERSLWIRPYMINETVKLTDYDVDNNVYGTLAGLDLSIGENSLLSFYIGYAGSTQKYEDIKINQTGYVLGATGMIIKDDYYLGLTANINFNKAESENDYGTDKFDINMYSVGAKAGYNIELGKNWILEPNLTLMYGTINTPEYKTKQGTGAKINSQSTNNVLIEPQVKAKLDLTGGWAPYALVGYVFNSGNKTKLVANNIAFDNMQITGYAEYGLGVNKSFKDSFWSCSLQVIGKCGDKNGFEGNLGVRYSF